MYSEHDCDAELLICDMGSLVDSPCSSIGLLLTTQLERYMYVLSLKPQNIKAATYQRILKEFLELENPFPFCRTLFHLQLTQNRCFDCSNVILQLHESIENCTFRAEVHIKKLRDRTIRCIEISELCTNPGLLVKPRLGVIELLLKLRARFGQRRIVAVQLLHLSMKFEVLVRESRLQPTEVLHLTRQLFHLSFQATNLVVLRRCLRLSLRLQRHTHARTLIGEMRL